MSVFRYSIDSMMISYLYSLARRRYIRATGMRNLRRQAHALAKRRMRVNGLADIHSVRAHLDRQRNLSDHVNSVSGFHKNITNCI